MEPQVAELLRAARQPLVDGPESAEAWGTLGTAYDAHGLQDVAEPCYRRAVELAPDEFRWTYLLAIVREINGAEADEVKERFARSLVLRPDYGAAYVRTGDALVRRGLFDEAAEQFRLALVHAPRAAVAYRGLGQALLRLGDAEGAVEQLLRATELEPSDRAAWSALAQAYARLGRDDEASSADRRAGSLEPANVIDDPVYHELVSSKSVASSRVFRRGIAHYREGRYAEAARDFEQVAAVRPEDPSVLYWLGAAYNHIGLQEEAIPFLARSVELDPGLVAARSALGEAYFVLGRYDESEAQYEAALTLGRDPAAAWLALAEVRMRQEDLEGVVEAYTKAAALRPLDAREEMNFGVALMNSDRPGQAVERFRRSLELRPANAHAHYNLGVAHRMLGDAAAATAEFERAVAIDPTHRAARELTSKP
jgi:tetratricopeptide (TPR) repeat protein